MTIDFGDGSTVEPFAGTVSHAYEKPGVYTVTARGRWQEALTLKTVVVVE